MSDNLILQIGRLDKNIEEKLDFVFEGKRYSASLSSIALKEHFGKDKTKVILIYPVSLPLNSSFKNYKIEDHFYKSINKILNDNNKKEEYLKKPQEFFKNHPHSHSVDYSLPIHSIGNYEGIEFKSTMYDFVLYIFSFLINEYLTNPFKNIYIDISSGLNIYIAALIEALKNFYVWENLFNLNYNSEKNNHIKSFIVYSDPIIGSSSKEYNLYVYEYKQKLLFSAPVTRQDIQDGISKKIIEKCLGQNREVKNCVNTYLKDFVILFSALKNTAPLLLFNYDIKEHEEIKKLLLDALINNILAKYKENWKEAFTIDHTKGINILLTFGFLIGIIKLIRGKNVSKRDVEIGELFSTTEEIYTHLGLEAQLGLFKHEIQANFGNDYEKISPYCEWKSLNSYMHKTIADNSKDNNSIYDTTTTQLNERNFFAHAGFEKNVTLIKKDNNNILLKYDPQYIERIINLVYEKE